VLAARLAARHRQGPPGNAIDHCEEAETPPVISVAVRTPKGYRLADFADVFDRYL
jgi:hypothetical protein